MRFQTERPPKNARRIYSWRDLSHPTNAAMFNVTDRNGNQFEVWVKDDRRKVLEGLKRTPLYSASYCRLGYHVEHLRKAGCDIETLWFRNDKETGRRTYGVYVLHGSVTLAETEGAS
ncbi:MAG: hypothetical protein AB3N23_10825 [Paracoccaceae bacterium]